MCTYFGLAILVLGRSSSFHKLGFIVKRVLRFQIENEKDYWGFAIVRKPPLVDCERSLMPRTVEKSGVSCSTNFADFICEIVYILVCFWAGHLWMIVRGLRRFERSKNVRSRTLKTVQILFAVFSVVQSIFDQKYYLLNASFSIAQNSCWLVCTYFGLCILGFRHLSSFHRLGFFYKKGTWVSNRKGKILLG